MHAMTINEKRSHEFEGEQEGAYRSIQKKDWEGRNIVIKLIYQK